MTLSVVSLLLSELGALKRVETFFKKFDWSKVAPLKAWVCDFQPIKFALADQHQGMPGLSVEYVLEQTSWTNCPLHKAKVWNRWSDALTLAQCLKHMVLFEISNALLRLVNARLLLRKALFRLGLEGCQW